MSQFEEYAHLLSEEEIENLRKIFPTGLEDEKKPRQKVILEEYYLIFTTECVICGDRTVQFYHMKNNANGDGLEGAEVEKIPDQEKPHTDHKKFYSCPCCFDFFMKKSKEELVNIILRRNGGK